MIIEIRNELHLEEEIYANIKNQNLGHSVKCNLIEMARNFTKLVLKTPPVTPSAAYISNGGCNKSAGRSSTPHTQIGLSEV